MTARPAGFGEGAIATGEKKFQRPVATSLKAFVIYDLPRIRTAKGINEEIASLVTLNPKSSNTTAGES